MRPETLAALRTPEGEAALSAAVQLSGDPLAAAAKLRAAGFEPELASAALTQAALRARAAGKFGPDAGRMFFTRAGLEQATRDSVARRRAQRLKAAGVRALADLGCGIGADALACAREGIAVRAYDSDPETAAACAANAATLGLPVRVECADASTVDLSGVDGVFCDPARRSGAGRVFDPNAYSPPWEFVVSLPQRVPATVVKLAPGLDHDLIPDGAEAEWVSEGGDLVEAALWFGPLATVPRRASVLRGGAVAELTGPGTVAAPRGSIERYLYDPDPAVLRSHLVAEFCAGVGARLADPHIAYAFAAQPVATPYARCFEVLAQLPAARKQLRAALRTHDIGILEIRKRGLNVDPDELRRDLRLSGSGSATLVLARLGDAPTALLCRPYPAG